MSSASSGGSTRLTSSGVVAKKSRSRVRTINDPSDDKRRAASQCHGVGLREMGYKLSQAILERTEHSAGKPTTGAQPVFPDCPHVRRQHQFIPKFDELVDVDEIADVVGRAFRQNLFVDADPILTIGKVVVGASAPADMRRQRYVIRPPSKSTDPRHHRVPLPVLRQVPLVRFSLSPQHGF